MSKPLILALCLSVMLFSVAASAFDPIQIVTQQPNQNCNITHFEFQNNISLGKNDELNRTFTKLGEKINSLNNVSWRVNDSVTYVITNANPTFYYRDTKQRAEIVGNDSIVIEGGFAQVTINFKWQKIGMGSKSGQATVKGLSDQIIFAKDIIIEGDFFRYELLDYRNITFDNPMNLSRIDPPIAADEQKDLMSLVNNILNVTTLRHELEDDIALYYTFYLKMNLHEENSPINKKFFYKWTSPIASKGDLVVNFTRRPTFIDIERDGMHYGYEATIDNFPESKCGPMPQVIPQNPKVYGGSQQFISYGFYENLLRYAMKNGQIDTSLNRQNWESRMFQFYAGDLYEVFPKVAQMYIASTEVTGDCKANWTNIKLYKAGNDTFNVSISEQCQLNINRTKILDFTVGLELEIQGRPTSDFLDFYLKSHTEFVTFYDTFGFKLENKPLAEAMVKHSLNRLYEDKLFGSGWPLNPQRDYPHYETESTSSIVFDSTHVNLAWE